MSNAKTNTDAELSEPQPDAEQDPLPAPQPPEEAPVQQPLRTWITTYDASTYSARYYQLNLLASDIHKLITDRTSEEYTLHEALEELYLSQRGYVLNMVSRLGATLIFVDVWKKERVVTVFGKVELAFLVWVTSGGIDDALDFPRMMGAPPPGRFAPPPPPPPLTIYSHLEGCKPNSDAGEESIDDTDDEAKVLPVRLTDAAGRKFVFPQELVQTWKEMHNLIVEAFPMDDHIKTFINKGHYDLIDASNDDIILPSVWQYFVKPGLQVKLRLWSISGTPPPPIAQLLPVGDGGVEPMASKSQASTKEKLSHSSPLPISLANEKETLEQPMDQALQTASSIDAKAAE